MGSDRPTRRGTTGSAPVAGWIIADARITRREADARVFLGALVDTITVETRRTIGTRDRGVTSITTITTTTRRGNIATYRDVSRRRTTTRGRFTTI